MVYTQHVNLYVVVKFPLHLNACTCKLHCMTLKDAREAIGWTQQKLEAESGVMQQQISRLERGDIGRVSLVDVQRILRALHRAGLKGLTADDLFPAPAEASERAS